MAVIHFPVTLLSSLFVWPVVTNVRYVFGFLDKNTSKVEWLLRTTAFFALIAFGMVALFGTILLEGINSVGEVFTPRLLRNFIKLKDVLVHGAIRDSQCSDSNLWVYICTLIFPNILYIAQKFFFG